MLLCGIVPLVLFVLNVGNKMKTKMKLEEVLSVLCRDRKMKLEDVLPALRQGKTIFRNVTNPTSPESNVYLQPEDKEVYMQMEDFLADNWQIDEEVLTFNECLHCLSCVCEGNCKK